MQTGTSEDLIESFKFLNFVFFKDKMEMERYLEKVKKNCTMHVVVSVVKECEVEIVEECKLAPQ